MGGDKKVVRCLLARRRNTHGDLVNDPAFEPIAASVTRDNTKSRGGSKAVTETFETVDAHDSERIARVT
jgi:hypothetical protein